MFGECVKGRNFLQLTAYSAFSAGGRTQCYGLAIVLLAEVTLFKHFLVKTFTTKVWLCSSFSQFLLANVRKNKNYVYE